MSEQHPVAESPIADTAAIPHWYAGGEVMDVTRGDGARVYDEAGTEYLDFLSQLYCVNAGHSNEAIIDAIADQARTIPYVAPSKGNDTRTRFADRLVDIAPASLSDVFFAVSGSEANEAAIQFARAHQDAPKILTRWRSYHGSTYGAAGLTGDPSTRATVERYAATTGTAKFLPPLPFQSPFSADTPEELARQAVDHLEFVIRNGGPDSIAAVLTEPVAGTSGAYPAPPGYFERVRELCNEYDILLIADEVITGFGRCGAPFGVQTESVEPDIITFAKGATSAYVPLAGVLTTPEIADGLRDEGIEIGQTFGGHPLGCAAGLAALDEYQDHLFDNARDLAPYLENRLRDLELDHDAVGDVHGRGFLWSVEFADPDSGEPFVDPWTDPDADNPVAEVREYAQEQGVLFGSGRPDTQVLVSPPLCIDQGDIDEAVTTLDGSITAVFG
jgi:taurine--2-oxoglutarate transaminase